MAALPILLLVLGVAAVIAVAVLSYRAEQRRRALLQGFAMSNGWSYTATDDTWCDRFAGTPFGQGDHRRATNVLNGPHAGSEIVAFDYSFQTSSTDSKGNRTTTTHRYAICGMRMPAPLSSLEITPESALTRLAGAIGFDDVELESEDFNRRFRIKARDPKLAYDVLSPRTMEALLARPALHIRLLDVDAVNWENGRLEPTALLARLSTLQVIVAGIPSFVWSDHSAGGASA